MQSTRKQTLFLSTMAIALAATILVAGVASAAKGPRIDPRLFRAGTDEDPLTSSILVFREVPGEPFSSDLALQSLAATFGPADFLPVRAWRSFPLAAARISTAALETLRSNSALVAIIRDSTVRMSLEQGVPLIRADLVHTRGFRGSGQVVAILDTGIDYKHTELGNAPFPNSKVIGGWDFANDDSDPKDDQGHGTAVAGIVASSHGVAPSAKLVSVKVLDENGEGSDSRILDGLDWVASNASRLGITVVNLSLGGNTRSGTCDTARADYATAFRRLSELGVAVVAASGNESKEEEVAEPACVSTAIAVGAVYDQNGLDGKEYCDKYDPLGLFCVESLCSDGDPDADEVCCYSNAGDALDLLAPAHDCRTTKKGGGWQDDFGGTSAAAPYASGAIALLLEAGGRRNPTELATVLRSTGRAILDKRTGRIWPRIDVEAAVASIVDTCTIPPPPEGLRGPSGPLVVGTGYTIAWNPLTDVVGYELEEWKNELSGSPFSTRRTTNLTSAAFSHDPPAATWIYRVRGERSCGFGPWSATFAVRVVEPGPVASTWVAVVGGVAHAPGLEGSLWRSDVGLFNPGSEAAAVSIGFLRSGRNNLGGDAVSIPIAAKSLVRIADVVTRFTSDDASGALLVGSDRPLVVESRTANVASGTSFGQGFAAQQLSDAIPAGGTGDLVLLRSNGDFRTNVGLVNLAATETLARVVLYGPDGAPLTTWSRILPPLGHVQDDDVFAPYGSFPEGELRAEVTIASGPGPVAAYASVIDRRSGDPTTIRAKKRE
jgi:subtilisin family serine protease